MRDVRQVTRKCLTVSEKEVASSVESQRGDRIHVQVRPPAAPQTIISIRELNRSTSAVVEKVRASDRPAVLTSHGRPVLLLVPLHDARTDLSGIAFGAKAQEEWNERIETLQALPLADQEVYAALSDKPEALDTIVKRAGKDLPGVAVSLGRLEIRGLARKTMGAYFKAPL
jgi:prevent-host-death family protein